MRFRLKNNARARKILLNPSFFTVFPAFFTIFGKARPPGLCQFRLDQVCFPVEFSIIGTLNVINLLILDRDLVTFKFLLQT